MTLVLYAHPLSSYCQKVRIGLRELDVPVEVRSVDLADPRARADFEALWPTAKIPLLRDGDRVVPETSIMLEYVQQRFGGALLPADPEARLSARLWDRLFDAYVMTPMQKIVGDRLRADGRGDPTGVSEARMQLRRAYDLIEQRLLDGGAWAVGETFTIADCAAAPSLFFAQTLEPFGVETPALAAYFERLLQRPAVADTFAEARPHLRHFPYRERLAARFWTPDEA